MSNDKPKKKRRKAEPPPSYQEMVPRVATNVADDLRKRALELRRSRVQDQEERARLDAELERQSKDRPILPIEEWIENPYFVGPLAGVPGKGGLFDAAKETVCRIFNGDQASNFQPYYEVILAGGIGSAKTTIALAAGIRCLYELNCRAVPQQTLGNMISTDEILFISMNTDEQKARDTAFARLKKIIRATDYFKNEMPPRRGPERWIDFPKRISWYPVGANDNAGLSENLHWALIDEINKFPYVENSKRSKDGKPYDLADIVEKACGNRITNRYFDAHTGDYPRTAKKFLVSQAQYPDDYLERRERFAKEISDRPILVVRRAEWDVRPSTDYEVQGWFWAANPEAPGLRPELYHEGSWLSDEAKAWREVKEGLGYECFRVPRKYLEAFQADIDEAMRTLAGRPSVSILPFIGDTQSIQAMPVVREREAKKLGLPVEMLRHPVHGANDDGSVSLDSGLSLVREWLSAHDSERGRQVPLCCPRVRRFMHFDGSLGVKDAAGVVVAHVHDKMTVTRITDRVATPTSGGSDSVPLTGKVVAPIIWVDLALRVVKPRGEQEIDLARLREIVFLLSSLGYRFKPISFDGWAGLAETQQKLREKAYETVLTSMDRDSGPYKALRRALKERRVLCYRYRPLLEELQSLEYNASLDKVSKAPHAGKDVSDSLAAVVWLAETDEDMAFTDNSISKLLAPRPIRRVGKKPLRDDFHSVFYAEQSEETEWQRKRRERIERRKKRGRRRAPVVIHSRLGTQGDEG